LDNASAKIAWSQDGCVRAYRFAAEAHQGQTVPGTALPYIMHVSLVSMEVMAALQAEPGHEGDLAVQCALLHDVIEDAGVTFERLEAEFGVAVAQGVLTLSKDKTVEKPLRMQDSLRRIMKQPHEVWMVKLADRITNLAPPPKHWTKEKIASYREEAIAIHAALKDASPFLAERLLARIRDYGV
jgi:(p)ppGpp synthase/HD superfamily hydrolase